MSLLSQQIQALRTPPDVRFDQSDDLDYHIVRNTLRFLDTIPTKTLAKGDDKSGTDPLEILRPDLDSLPYLYTLNAQIDIATHSWKDKVLPKALEPGGALWQKIVIFVEQFDAVEIRYARLQWRDLMSAFERIARHSSNQSTVTYMAQAMLRLDPSAGTFTSSHLIFVRLCVQAKFFGAARLILDHDIHSLPPSDYSEGILPCSPHHLSNGYITMSSGLTGMYDATDILRYYLLGAMAYIGLRDWIRASFYLEFVLSMPTNNTATGIMLEAYKKWVLVGLLIDGKTHQPPTTVNSSALKTIRSASKAYEALAEAFKRSNFSKFLAEVTESRSIIGDDGNHGLLRIVAWHHRKLSVIKLQNVYAAVPMTTLASMVGMSVDDTEGYVRDLITQGLLDALIEPSKSGDGPSILRFLQDAGSGPLAKSEDQLRQELVGQSRRIKALASQVDEADRRLGLTNEYFEHVRRSRRAEQDRTSPDRDGMDQSPVRSPLDDDESVMADVG